jgi:predicted nuclease with TOPRIM domain
MKDILVPTAPGELIDKLTILRLKTEKVSDPAKLANIRHEKSVLDATASEALPDSAELAALWEELYQINAALWKIEDDIRDCEAAGDFGPTFIELARAVYVTNDQRADVKKRINLHLGSALIEEKSYADYKGGAS